MKFVATIIFDLEENFEGRKPDDEMIKRYLSSRIHKGSVNEVNFRGKVVLNIKRVQAGVMDID